MVRDMTKPLLRTMFLLGLFSVSACSSDSDEEDTLTASATIQDPDGSVIGTADFVETDGTLTITVEVTVDGAADSMHAIHIHDVGTCSPDFAAAGPHYNPFDDALGEFAGDLDLVNLELDADGEGTFEVESTRLTLDPDEDGTLFDEDGSSIMLHAEPNDSEGAAGARIGCGIVEAD